MTKRLKELKPQRGQARWLVKMLCVTLVLALSVSMFSGIVWADFLAFGPTARTTLKWERSSTFKYRFSLFGANGLPPEFGQTRNDYPNPNTFSVHGDHVNFYYVKGPDGANRAVYCFEPNNPYLEESNNAYTVNKDIPAHSQMYSISQEQRDMLAYVMAEGETEYTNTRNPKTVATQLAVWMVGAGHYKSSGPESWIEKLLPLEPGNYGIAPNDSICKQARALLTMAMERVMDRPSFANIGNVKMDWDGVQYSVTLEDTNGKLTQNSEWGKEILKQLTNVGLTGTINNTNRSLTIVGDPGVTGKEISIKLGNGKKGNIVFLDNKIEANSGHRYFISRQSLITINTLEGAEAGNFSLYRANPTIRTSAKNELDGTQETKPVQLVTIVDTVTYEDLIPGRSYTLKGTIMDKSTGQPIKVNGAEVTQTLNFTPAQANGTVDITFTFDARELDGKTLVVFEDLLLNGKEIAVHHEINDRGQTIDVLPAVPEIATSAKSDADGLQMVKPIDPVTIVDTVTYKNLIPGTTYTLNGVLMVKRTGQPLMVGGLEVRSTITFTPTTKNGTVELKFTFDAIGLDGESLVVFEELNNGNIFVADHKDINDLGQTIDVTSEPWISTSAKNNTDGTKIITPNQNVSIIDTVTYVNLTTSNQLGPIDFTIIGTLMDKATGQPLLENNAPVTAQRTFQPAEEDGTIDITFIFDASELAGKTLVVFEELWVGGVKIAEHKNINDRGQTIEVTDEPSISTSARNGADQNSQTIYPDQTVTIVDTVTYSNLKPGTVYTLTGILMDKGTGNPLLVDGNQVTATITFTPARADGTVNLIFRFNARALSGKTLVVFETLEAGGIEVATHNDINDKEQTIEVIPREPVIRTSAKNKADNTQIIRPNLNVTIVDTVTYSNLIPGTTYTLEGVLMDKSTNAPLLVFGQQVTATTTFTPTQANGTVELEFTFNARALSGKTLVVFEDLLRNGVSVAKHADINDKDQSIEVKPEETTTPTTTRGGGGGGGSNTTTQPVTTVERTTTQPTSQRQTTTRTTETVIGTQPDTTTTVSESQRGGGNPEVPPVPTELGNTIVPNGPGSFIEMDENDVPLGEWRWDDDTETWIFDEYPPLGTALPKTGMNGASTNLFFLVSLTLLAVSAVFVVRHRKLQRTRK